MQHANCKAASSHCMHACSSHNYLISQTAGPVCVRAQSDGQLHGIKVTETQPYSFPPLQTNIAKLRKLKNFTHTHIDTCILVLMKLDTLHKHCYFFNQLNYPLH